MRFYLKQGISPSAPNIYYVCWTDNHGRGQRRSTRTTDFSEAQVALSRFVLEHDKPRDLRPEQLTLKHVLLQYWEKKGKSRATTLPIKYCMKDIWEHLGDCTIAEFDSDRQRQYIEKLESVGQSGPTIARRLSVLVAALNVAVEDGVIGSAPHIHRPEATVRPGVRRFSVDELSAVFRQGRTENERLMLLLWTTTLCRPGQVLDLTWNRVDFEEGTIDFNVPGRRITNKRRAKVLMCPTLRAYLLERRSSGYVLQNSRSKGEDGLKGFKNQVKRMIRRAGLTGSAYRIRKAGASYLANTAVPYIQIQQMMAHKVGDGETYRYTEADLPPALKAIERLLTELNVPWLPSANRGRDVSIEAVMLLRAANDPA